MASTLFDDIREHTSGDTTGNDSSETAIISIDSVSGADATESGTQSVTITITEDDAKPTISFSSSTYSVDEGDDLTITFTMSGLVAEDVYVGIYSNLGGTATQGTDYTMSYGSVTIPEGQLSGTRTFSTIDDNIYEGNETAITGITGIGGGSASPAVENGTQEATITIVEDENAPSITLSASASSIAEDSSGNITLTATSSVEATEDITVAITTSGTASEGTDYSNISDITISAGSTTGTTTFSSINNGAFEGDKTATIEIDSVSGADATENGTQSLDVTITEDETTPTVSLSVSSSSIAENSASTLTITATMSATISSDVTVALSTSGTAVEGTHYAAISDIVISANSTTGTTTFDPTNNSAYDNNNIATIDIDTVSGGALEDGTQQITISISEDESAPIVTLGVSASSITENSGSSLTLTATSSTAPYEDITVSISTSGISGLPSVEGTDYAIISDITIPAGATTGTASFTPTDDNIYEENEGAIVSISNTSGSNATFPLGGSQSVTITITDNESVPEISLSVSSNSIVEDSGGTITITATTSVLWSDTTELSIDIQNPAGTANSSTDYSFTSCCIAFPGGQSSASMTFTPTADSYYEGNETAIFSINRIDPTSGGAGGRDAVIAGGSQSETITIVDDETIGAVSLSSSASSTTENGSNITITASITTASEEEVVVNLSAGGTATNGTDYATISSITIAAGQTSGTATFNPTNDSIYDATSNETAIFTISSITGDAQEDGTQSLTLTIVDDESAPTVSLSSTAISNNAAATGETETDTSDGLNIIATLSTATFADVTVAIDTSGTATEGTDYNSLSDITISAGNTTGTVQLIAVDDSMNEPGETAIIDIGSVSGGSASENGTQQLNLTISDNDPDPTVTLLFFRPGSSYSEDSGESYTIRATLSGTTYETVTVAFSGTGTATEGSDYSNISDITIASGQTSAETTITLIDDNIYEGNETLGIQIDSVSGGGASINGGSQVSGQTDIIDDETTAPTVTLTTSGSTIAENAGSSLTLTATLSVATTEDVTVALDTAGTSINGTDYSSLSTITVTAGQTTGTTLFTPTNDSIYELNETAIISIDTVSGGSATENGTQSVTLTITNDESAPTVSLSSSASTIDENGGGSITITATASGATYQNISVPISTSGTATEGVDYNNGSTVSDITISAGATTGTATLTPVADTNYEGGSETAIVNITVSGGGASENGSQAVTITITNEALDSGTQATYYSSDATALLSDFEFNNIEVGDSAAASNPSPWETINLHKAHAYRKYGTGETIAVVDDGYSFGCTVGGSYYSHPDIANHVTNMDSYGSWTCAGEGIINSHGDAVIATAGALDNNYGIVGVAPGVDSWACAATAKRESANDLMVSDMVMV